jgi:hypothetical protein
MSNGITVHVSGFAELGKALDEMNKSTAKGVMRRILIAAGKPVAATAAGMVHVGRDSKRRKGGRLRDSATSGTKLSKRQKREHKKEETTSFTESFIGFGPIVEAITEEFGTVRGVKPHPALRPAWDGGKMDVLNYISKNLATEIEKTAARAAKRAAAKALKLSP